jgi:prohibitin 2
MQPSNQNNMLRKYIALGAVGALVLIALITLFSSMRSIETGQVGVVTNYGKVTGRELSEGLNFITPWGVDEVTSYNTKTQKVDANAAAPTKDLQDVNATIVLTYHVNRGKVSEIHQKVGADYQKVEIDPQVQEAFKAVSAQYTAGELITSRPIVKETILKNLKERVEKDGRYTVEDVAITNFTFSEAFNQAIEAVQIANQQIAKAKQELETTKVNAEKEIAAAQGASEAQRLQQQSLTPELLRKMELENQAKAIEKWNGVQPTTVASNNGLLFNIPTGR